MLVGVPEMISFSIFKTNILSTTWIFSTYSNYVCVLNQTRGSFIFFLSADKSDSETFWKESFSSYSSSWLWEAQEEARKDFHWKMLS